jgi:ubiquinone/menaquinone biosynthesis C-methylase UbiE
MLMNWPERVWIYSPVRPFFISRHIERWRKLYGPRPKDKALEIGCGLGKGAQLLVNRLEFAELIAFDIEEKLVHRSSRNLPSRFSPRIRFIIADAQKLPFPDKSFDSVVNFGIIHHVLDWRGCIREIARVLKPEGRFFFEEIYPPLYANFVLGPLLRHPREDRFYEPEFLSELEVNGLHLLEGVRTGSRFGIVGVAQLR